MSPLKKALGKLRKITTSNSNKTPPLCYSPLCPLPLGHLEGKYLFEDQPAEKNNPIWGESNPPPSLWKDYERLVAGIANDEDKDEMSKFAEHHAWNVDGEKGDALIG